jgi:hypothetical protein
MRVCKRIGKIIPLIHSLRTIERRDRIPTRTSPSPVIRSAFGKRASSFVGKGVGSRDGLDIMSKKYSLFLLGTEPQPSNLKSVT